MKTITKEDAVNLFNTGDTKLYKNKRFHELDTKERTEDEEAEYTCYMMNNSRHVAAVQVKENMILKLEYNNIVLDAGDYIVSSEEHMYGDLKNNNAIVFLGKETFQRIYQ